MKRSMFVPALVIFCVALAALDVAGAVAVRPMDATTSTRQSTTISSDRATAFRRIWGMRSALPVLRPLHSSVAGDSAFKQRPLNRALLRSTRIRALAEDGREMTADDFASLPPYHNPMLVDTLDDLEFAPLLAIDQMEENSAVERVVDYHRAVYAASIAKRGDATALAAVQRAHWNVAMSGQLRLLPPFPNDMRHLPRASEDDRELMFWFWRYRNEGLVVPPHLNWAAAKKLDLIVGRSGLELMAMSDGAKRDELRRQLMFHRWEAQQVEEARITPATSEQCSTVVSELQSLIFDPSDAEALPRMLQALDNARFCHPQMQAWRSFASCYASQNPWDLFNAAEHYFHQHDTSTETRREIMGRIAYYVYHLPRAFHLEDPWPRDVLMLMIDYLDEHAIDHMGNFIRVVGKSGNAFEASTPSQRWMTFILNVQCKLHDIVDRHEELHPPLSIASTSAYLQPFERALGRVQPRVHEVINLYERFSAHLLRYIFHMKQRDAQGAGRSFVYVPIVKIHYMRLMKLMHEQLSVAEFCERVKTINSDMALFGVGPNLTGIVHGLAGCIDFWQVAKDAFARGAQDLASRAVDAAFRR